MKNKRFKLILIPIYIIYLFAIVSLILPIKKYVLYLPGNINEIKDELIIENKVNHNEFYSVYVIRKKAPTLFQLFVGMLNYGTDIELALESEKDSFLRGQIQEELSYQRSLINAYEKASLVDSNIAISYQTKGFIITYSVNEQVKVGDIITKIDSVDITSKDNNYLLTYLRDKQTVEVEVIRDEVTLQLTMEKALNNLFGIAFEQYLTITNATPSYETFYNKDLIGGPSGGLMQTLSIYATLLNYQYNLKIAGTGTIELNGNVGPIGGIKQKVLTVNKKVDIFLVPEVHYEEALKAYKKLRNPAFLLFEVKTFEEAITILHQYLQ